jgi:hypothetical protein
MAKVCGKFNNLKILIIILFVLMFNFNKLYAAEKESDHMKLLFQELLFGDPQDHFYVVDFNLQNGRISFMESLDYKNAIEKYGKVTKILKKSIKTFLLANSRDKKYKVVYYKQSNGLYEYGLFDNSRNTYEKYDTRLLWAGPKDIAYLDANSELIENIYGAKPVKLTSKIDSFIRIPTDDEHYYVFNNCELRKITRPTKATELIWKRASLITESGSINDIWGWFYERKNEKTTGNLLFIKLSNYETIKGPENIPQCKLVSIITK